MGFRSLYKTLDEVPHFEMHTFELEHDDGVAWKAGSSPHITIHLSTHFLEDQYRGGGDEAIVYEISGVNWHDEQSNFQVEDKRGILRRNRAKPYNISTFTEIRIFLQIRAECMVNYTTFSIFPIGIVVLSRRAGKTRIISPIFPAIQKLSLAGAEKHPVTRGNVSMKFIIVDKDEAYLIFMVQQLKKLGHEVSVFRAAPLPFNLLQREKPDGLFWNSSMLKDSDVEALKQLKAVSSPSFFIALTDNINGAVPAKNLAKEPFCKYFRRPESQQDFEGFLNRIFITAFSPTAFQVLTKNRHSGFVSHQQPDSHLYSKETLKMAGLSALNDIPVLIQGEMGTCKTSLAYFIHQKSQRKNGAFVKFSCASIPEDEFERALFGEDGESLNNKAAQRVSAFNMAKGGTLFLEAVDKMPPRAQMLLETHLHLNNANPSSKNSAPSPACRIIAATSACLPALVENHRFRHDLYYQMSILKIQILPLRERQKEIPDLIRHFIKKNPLEKIAEEFSPKAIECLSHFSWPGNFAQLESMIQHLMVTVTEPVIMKHHLPREVLEKSFSFSSLDTSKSLKEILYDVEYALFQKALNSTKGKKKLAARQLKIPYSTFRLKYKQMNLS